MEIRLFFCFIYIILFLLGGEIYGEQTVLRDYIWAEQIQFPNPARSVLSQKKYIFHFLSDQYFKNNKMSESHQISILQQIYVLNPVREYLENNQLNIFHYLQTKTLPYQKSIPKPSKSSSDSALLEIRFSGHWMVYV